MSFVALQGYQVARERAAQYPDSYGITRAEERFAALAGRLPRSARIGYLTDLEPSHQAYAAAFLAVRYALAPRQTLIPDKGSAPEWAAGNFSRSADYAALGAAHGYAVVEDFGNGVVLFRRQGAR